MVALRKYLILIDNVTERSIRYVYRITCPPFWIFFGDCFDVTGVGVFSLMKSAGFVNGLGASFRLIHFSAVPPVTSSFLIYTQEFFVYVIPLPFLLFAFTVRPSYFFFIFGYFIAYLFLTRIYFT